MSIYLYTARDIFTQKKVKGEIEGENEADIRQILMDKNLYPEKIRIKNILNQDIKFFPSKISCNLSKIIESFHVNFINTPPKFKLILIISEIYLSL